MEEIGADRIRRLAPEALESSGSSTNMTRLASHRRIRHVVYAAASIIAFLAAVYTFLPLFVDSEWINNNSTMIVTHLTYLFVLLLLIWAYFTKPVPLKVGDHK